MVRRVDHARERHELRAAPGELAARGDVEAVEERVARAVARAADGLELDGVAAGVPLVAGAVEDGPADLPLDVGEGHARAEAQARGQLPAARHPPRGERVERVSP